MKRNTILLIKITIYLSKMYLRSLHDIFSLLLLRIPRLLILRCSTTFSMVGSSYLLLTLQYWVFPIQHNPGKKKTPQNLGELLSKVEKRVLLSILMFISKCLPFLDSFPYVTIVLLLSFVGGTRQGNFSREV